MGLLELLRQMFGTCEQGVHHRDELLSETSGEYPGGGPPGSTCFYTQYTYRCRCGATFTVTEEH